MLLASRFFLFFFFQAEDGIRDKLVTGVQTCALPIFHEAHRVEEERIGEIAHQQHAADDIECPAALPPGLEGLLSLVGPGLHAPAFLSKTAPPRYRAPPPSSSSIRSNRLYLAVRSVRDSEPVLIWPVFRPTAKSAIVTSSVSPDRWDTTAV